MCVEVTDEAVGGDPTFLHSLSVGEHDFADLKADQAILVDFSAFPELFIDLLKQCVESRRDGTGKCVFGHGGLARARNVPSLFFLGEPRQAAF
jgi:hypothetical protein